MPRHVRISVVVLVVGLAVAAVYFFRVAGRLETGVEITTATNPFMTPPEPLFAPTDPPLDVTIFFPSKTGEPLLTAEDRVIFKSGEVTDRAKQIVATLLDGPESDGAYPALSEETRVQELHVFEDGTAFVDFSDAISVNHPGGIVNEQATIYAVVNSIAYNLPEVQLVKILIGGVEKETLAGHCLLMLPIGADLSITDIRPGDRTAFGRSSLTRSDR